MESVLDLVPTELKLRDRLGVVVDADTDVAKRWRQLRGRCRDAGVILPDAPDPNGTLVETPRGRFGVWLMPDNRADGALEAFLETMIPQDDRVRGLARAATRRARRVGAPFRTTDEPKAILGAWLAWQDPPAKPYGMAITSRALGDSELARRFVGWLSRLFELG